MTDDPATVLIPAGYLLGFLGGYALAKKQNADAAAAAADRAAREYDEKMTSFGVYLRDNPAPPAAAV